MRRQLVLFLIEPRQLRFRGVSSVLLTIEYKLINMLKFNSTIINDFLIKKIIYMYIF